MYCSMGQFLVLYSGDCFQIRTIRGAFNRDEVRRRGKEPSEIRVQLSARGTTIHCVESQARAGFSFGASCMEIA